jgi:hypothetical protein
MEGGDLKGNKRKVKVRDITASYENFFSDANWSHLIMITKNQFNPSLRNEYSEANIPFNEEKDVFEQNSIANLCCSKCFLLGKGIDLQNSKTKLQLCGNTSNITENLPSLSR